MYLKQIEIVIFDQKHFSTFQSTICTRPPSTPAMTSSSVDPDGLSESSQKSNRSRMEALETKIDPSHSVMIYFTSNSTANNKKVSSDAVLLQQHSLF